MDCAGPSLRKRPASRSDPRCGCLPSWSGCARCCRSSRGRCRRTPRNGRHPRAGTKPSDAGVVRRRGIAKRPVGVGSPWMRGAWGIALLVALFVGALPAAARADATPWDIGAAKVDTTPPAFDPAQDLQDFPETDLARGVTCPRAIYSGVRLWRFEEPYQDTDGSGAFSYPVSGDPGTAPAPEPFCDYNHNGRWDGIYLSGGSDHPAKAVHDPIDARAVAFSDGTKTVALVSVVAQGIFENYIREARTQAQALAAQPPHQSSCGHIDEMVVSSNHNESSPDTVGIYGAPEDPTGSFGVSSGIDEYYMDWLDEQMANAA